MKQVFIILILIAAKPICSSEAGQESMSFEDRLKAVDPVQLANEARRRGDPRRGALVFYTSAAGCVNCHQSGQSTSPLGPDLATIGKDLTDRHIVESLLFPSRSIRKGHETITLITKDGRSLSGLIAREDERQLVLREAANLEKETIVAKDNIDDRIVGATSLMPIGLVGTLRNQRNFFDLVRYIIDVAQGGPDRAAQLAPPAEQLLVKDDSTNLDHAGILNSFRERDLIQGEEIYRGLCINCHGADGNKPSLPTARAFGSQPLKYGADPYRMFLTLTRGNGLMAPTSHLSPKERYQVVHYIREEFMRSKNPTYVPMTDEYLDSLPKGTETGAVQLDGERDFGPALASQLGRDVNSALTVKLDSTTIAYNLHTLDQAGIWKDGFLNLDETQHMRGRGGGTPQPKGKEVTALAGWQWGHDGTLDYPRDGLLPRGPLPNKWLDYRGHYLHGDQLVLRYQIDGREILEHPLQLQAGTNEPVAEGVRHTLRIGPGKALILAVAKTSDSEHKLEGVVPFGANRPVGREGFATSHIAVSGQLAGTGLGEFTAASAVGDTAGMTWTVDALHRLVLRIPSDAQARLIEVTCYASKGDAALLQMRAMTAPRQKRKVANPDDLTHGGPARWPQILTTIGYPGLQQGAYAVDTLTIPDSTPWNTWFRTSALDFLPDGRMVLATHGGDIWLVSGIDQDLMSLKWKRFAAGLYEPFGVRVVNGQIYVTCKDRLTRLHDLNGDDEADYYESFSADTDVSTFFHAFNFDLQTDSEGSFYSRSVASTQATRYPGPSLRFPPTGAAGKFIAQDLGRPTAWEFFQTIVSP